MMRLLWTGVGGLILGGLLSYFFYPYLPYSEETKPVSDSKASSLATTPSQIPIPETAPPVCQYTTQTPSFLFSKTLPKLELVIPDADYEEKFLSPMAAFAQRFQQSNKDFTYLGRPSLEWAKGELFVGEQRYPIKLRLKGHRESHFREEKPSFRVELKKGSSWQGMTKFSLHHPRERYYMMDWMYLNVLREHHLVAPRYGFVEVSVNGEDKGIYGIEEFFTEAMLTASERQWGPILKAQEDSNLIEDWMVHPRYQNLWIDTFPFKIYGTKRLQKDPLKKQQAEAAYGLINRYRNKQIGFCEAFDCVQFMCYFGLVNLFGSAHSLLAHNVRLYYNPQTSLIEPIGFDGKSVPLINSFEFLSGLEQVGRWSLLFNEVLQRNPHLQVLYQRELVRVSHSKFVSSLLQRYERWYQHYEEVLKTEFSSPKLTFEYMKSILNQNAKVIRRFFRQPQNLDARHRLLKVGKKRYLEIEVANIASLHFTLKRVRVGKKTYRSKDWETCPGAENPLGSPPYLAWERFDRPRSYYSFCIPLKKKKAKQAKKKLPKVTVYAKVTYLDLKVQQVSTPMVPLETETLGTIRHQRLEDLLTQFDFLEYDAETATIRIPYGEWEIHKTMHVPAGYTLKAGPGVKLYFAENTSLISYSPLQWKGTQNDPIHLSDLKQLTWEGYKPWGSLAVIDAVKPSNLEYVVVNNASQWKNPAFLIPSGVFFLRSPVSISSSAFVEHQGPTALTIQESDFQLDRLVFRDLKYTALKSLFSEGSLKRVHLREVEQHGVVIHGGKVLLKDSKVSGLQGSAVITDVEGQLRIKGLVFDKTQEGLTAKGGSRITAAQLEGLNEVPTPLNLHQARRDQPVTSIHLKSPLPPEALERSIREEQTLLK